jgi:hypothetical protein
LGERCLCKAEVRGSIPLGSTDSTGKLVSELTYRFSISSGLRLKKRLDRATFVHRTVAFCHLFKREHEFKHPIWMVGDFSHYRDWARPRATARHMKGAAFYQA